MVSDDRVMADVIAAPENDVVSDPDERVDDGRVEDEAVVAQLDRDQDVSTRADVGDQLVAEVLAAVVDLRSGLVHPAEADCDEERVGVGRMSRQQTLKRDDWQSQQFVLGDELLVDREGRYLVVAVLTEVNGCYPGEVADAEDDDGLHESRSLRTRIVHSQRP